MNATKSAPKLNVRIVIRSGVAWNIQHIDTDRGPGNEETYRFHHSLPGANAFKSCVDGRMIIIPGEIKNLDFSIRKGTQSNMA